MDIVITGMIILIIVLGVAPFFLLSGAFGAPRKSKGTRDRNDGPVVPTPTDASGPFPGLRKRHEDGNDDGDGDSDGSNPD